MLTDKVSVIIPVYNSEKTIIKCINSLMRQSYANFQLVVVNDGSTDSSLSLINKIAKNDSRITVINQRNKGVSEARNTGLKNIDSKYVTFVDSDDYVDEDYLSNLMRGYEYKDIDLVISGINYMRSGKKTSIKFKEGKYSSRKILNNILKNNGVMGYLWNKLWRVDVINKLSLTFKKNITIGEDLLFAVEYINNVSNIYLVNNCNYYHVNMPNSLSKSIELDQSNHQYKKGFSDMIRVSRKILYLVSGEDKLLVKNAKAHIGIIEANYIRRLIKDKSEQENKKLIGDLQKENINYLASVLIGNTIIPFKQRLMYSVTIFAPKLMKVLDEKRK